MHDASILQRVERAAALGDLKLFYSWMSLQKSISGIWGDGFLKQISMPHISFQSHLENISSWKAGSPASNPRRLKPSFAAVMEEQSVYYIATILGDHSSVTKPSPSLHETGLFSAAATKGWAWCNKNAELVERTAAPRDLKLLLGSGGFDITKGMDSLDTHFEHISFRHWLTYFQRWAAERLAATLPTQCC